MDPNKRTTWIGLIMGVVIYVVNGLVTGNWADPTVITTSTAVAALGKSAAGEETKD